MVPKNNAKLVPCPNEIHVSGQILPRKNKSLLPVKNLRKVRQRNAKLVPCSNEIHVSGQILPRKNKRLLPVKNLCKVKKRKYFSLDSS